MRIGQLTLPFNWNYGGILQGYALNKVLIQLGHEPVIISRRQNRPNPLVKWMVYFKWAIFKKLSYIPVFRVLPLICVETFKRKHLKQITKNVFSDKQLQSIVSEYNFEGYVVGSDQIWNFTAAPHINNAFLDFVPENKNIKKVSYAASFAVNTWNYPEKETELCKALVKKFDGVSVREASGIEFCKTYFNVKAEHHLDPTMLLPKEDYQYIIKSSKCASSNGKLLLYILDDTPERRKIAHHIQEVTNLKPFGVRQFKKVEIIKNALKGIYPSVEQWLKCFNDAEYVVTDSFHGTVFSIIFNKPFICLGNKARGLARFESLLNNLGLIDRLVLNFDEIQQINFNEEINWKEVNSVIELEKQKSIVFLKNHFN
ncbi:polysaccharide pyruvyl transferase family protein [Tamlana sp. 62-3]|uniref:Polysaccharide pyruvyl transferase family protein n=1 Tax=Neotamlana sargassicola TaxID=2883125 RepID=A0A9X1I8C1_9FLAO|nr:polysaccharide pyruvyl transferase family protein [Tamlana sargassicola]MCB4809218.1 polysaccharide pyruvyl transferase family protein [Tamlana sargassicola]